MISAFLNDTKLCTMRTVVILQLFLAWKNRLFIDQLYDGLFPADADGIRGRASTTCGERVEGVLGSAVFQGMEGYYRHSSALVQAFCDVPYGRGDYFELTIDFDPEYSSNGVLKFVL